MAETTRLEGVYTIRLENGPALRELEKFTKELFDVRAEKKELTKETRNLIAEEKKLEQEINKAGVATEEQAAALASVRKRREDNNKAVAEAITIERGLSSQTRELTNDLSGLTEQGLRFRDKMADAFTKALEGSQVFSQLGARAEFLQQEITKGSDAMAKQEQRIAELKVEFEKGAKSQQDYNDELARLNTEIDQGKNANDALKKELSDVSVESDQLRSKIQDLNEQLRKGEIDQQQYREGLSKIEAETKKAGDATGALNSKFDAFVKNQGQELKSTLSSLALQYVGVQAAVTGLVNVAGDAFNTIKDFEKALSGVSALGGQYAENIGRISEATKTAGIAFGFTAVESVGAVEALAKAGVSVEDILGGGLEGALTLAAAGSLDVQTAAEAAAKAMVQFGLSGTDVTHIADLFANSANKALGEVSDITAALNQSGQVANQFGLSIEETVGTLTAFANAGLLGSDAGTSFRTMLIRLSKPTEESAALMERLGINAFDAQGEFVGMEALAGQLQTQLKDLTEEQRNSALATIFGTDAIRSASVLYEGGAESVEKWTTEVSESGEAARIAEEKTNNLSGDVDKLSSAWDAAVLSGGSLTGVLRGIIQSFTEMVQFFSGTDSLTKDVESFTSRVQTAFEKLGGKGKLVADEGSERVQALRLITESVVEQIDHLSNEGIAIDFDIDYNYFKLQMERVAKELAAAQLNGNKIEEAAAHAAFAAIQEQVKRLKELTTAKKESAVLDGEHATKAANAAETVVQARARIKASIEVEQTALDGLAATDTAGIARGEAKIASLQKELDAIGGKTKAVKDLTTEQKAQLELEKQIAGLGSGKDVVTKVQQSLETLIVPNDKSQEQEVLKSGLIELDAIREEFRLKELEGTTTFNDQRKLLDAEFYDAKLIGQDEYNARSAAITTAYQEQVAAAESQLLSQAANTLGELASISKEGSAEYKALALGQTLINTYMGATAAFGAQQVPGDPSSLPRGIAAAAMAIVSGLINVGRIKGFAEGGDVSGSVTSSWGPSVTRSNGDNVLVRAGRSFVTLKTGEKVLNERQQRELEQRTHPGIWGDIGLPGYTSTMTDFRKAQHIAAFADGGEIVGSITPRPSPSTIVNSQMVSSLEAFAERPMYVDVHEINSVQGKVSVQEQRSSL